MIAEELITDSIVPLKTSDTGLKALSMMEEYRVSHLPIVNNEEFLGLISDTDIYDFNSPESPLWNHQLSLIKPFVSRDQHIYDVIKLISTEKLSLVPVLDEKLNYLGVITLSNLMQRLSKIGAIDNPGGIIILELNVNDYSLTEIASIIESNDAKILSCYVTSPKDSTKLELTLKVNKTDIAPILQTFNRYNYFVKAHYHETEFIDDLRNRFDSLMSYLNI